MIDFNNILDGSQTNNMDVQDNNVQSFTLKVRIEDYLIGELQEDKYKCIYLKPEKDYIRYWVYNIPSQEIKNNLNKKSIIRYIQNNNYHNLNHMRAFEERGNIHNQREVEKTFSRIFQNT
jgi:hypothetical protein